MDIWVQEYGFESSDLATTSLDADVRGFIVSKLEVLYDQLQVTRSGLFKIERDGSQMDPVESQSLLPTYRCIAMEIRGLAEMQLTIRMGLVLHSNDGSISSDHCHISRKAGRTARPRKPEPIIFSRRL
jgi:hypothetical protein